MSQGTRPAFHRVAIEAGHRDNGDAEQDQAVATQPRSRQPVAGAQALPEMSHFAAEFYECCAILAGRLLTLSKVWTLLAKLLAMQRDPF